MNDAPLPSPAEYFPVSEAPLQMIPGLFRLGTDFGQGRADGLFFQRDQQAASYWETKARAPSARRFVHAPTHQAETACAEALRWMMRTLRQEHPAVGTRLVEALRTRGLDLSELLDAATASDFVSSTEESTDWGAAFDIFARHVQEDFAMLTAGQNDQGETLAMDVRFPSGWHPEQLRAATFSAIHQPVPTFAIDEKGSAAMVRAMVDRGPYVRFVWTLCAAPDLDQHPSCRDRLAQWEGSTETFFRVERQVTVPLPETRSSVFLIRTYVRPWEALSESQKQTLLQAIRAMPEPIRAYKNLPTAAQLQQRIVLAAPAS